MKILEVIPQLGSGGGERFTVDLCNELSKSHDVTLLVLHSPDQRGFYKSEILPKVHVLSFQKKKGFDITLMFKVAKLIATLQPDIVHTHLRAIVYTALSALRFSDQIKFFHTVHSDAEKEAGDKISTLIRRFCFKKRKITPITISHESHQTFLDFYNCNATMIVNGRNIPSEIEVSGSVKKEFLTYRKKSETRVLVNLARIDKVKRQTMLARIASRLTKEGYDFSILMIGSLKYQELVDEIKSYACPNVFILGEKTNPLEYLKMADAYCLCSLYEGLPISFIEALGVGIVPVCTPVGGIKDIIISGKNGLLASDIEEETYYNLLKSFLQMPTSELENMKIKAHESYAPYSMTECAKKYESLFKNQKK